METQRVTEVDIAHGRIRIPITGDAKSVFPRTRGPVTIVLNGEELEVPYDPRMGPGRERSGVLRVGREHLSSVKPDSRLPIAVDGQRRIVIGAGITAHTTIASSHDSRGHWYEEFQMSDNEHIRVTYVPFQEWAGGPTVRIQKRDFRGRMVPGPELPARLAGDLAKALVNVLSNHD